MTHEFGCVECGRLVTCYDTGQSECGYCGTVYRLAGNIARVTKKAKRVVSYILPND